MHDTDPSRQLQLCDEFDLSDPGRRQVLGKGRIASLPIQRVSSAACSAVDNVAVDGPVHTPTSTLPVSTLAGAMGCICAQ